MNATCNVSLVNATCLSTKATTLAPWYTNSFYVTMVILYIIVIFSALLGNILVCIAVYINPNLRQNAASYFIVSLAVSDIGTASFAMSFDVQAFTMHRRWYHGEALCIVWTTAYLITVPSSIWNLFVMSVDRYKTLKNPWNRFKESQSMTKRRAFITIAILWVYCLGFALLPVMVWTLRAYSQSVYNNYCRFNISLHYSVVGSLMNFYLPMFAMCGIYYKVYRIAHSHRKCPQALETRLHKVSTNESHTAGSTLFNADSLSPPSIDQQHSQDGDTDNKQDNGTVDTTVGLENVSFFLDENSGTYIKGSSDVRDMSVITKMQREPTTRVEDKETQNEDLNTKALQNDTNVSGYFGGAIQANDQQYGLEKKDISTSLSYNLNDKKCRKQQQKHDVQHDHASNNDYYGSNKCGNEKDVFVEDTKKKFLPAKVMLSSKPASAVSDHLSSFERDNLRAKQRGLKKSFDDVLDEQILEKPQQLTSHSTDPKENLQEFSKIKSNLIKSSSEYSLSKEGGRFLPLKKRLNQKSAFQSDEDVCSLKKFDKKSDDDASHCVKDQRGKMNDTLTYSNKRKLKHFAMNTKAARTISIIVGAFLICWMPFTTMSVGFNICGPPCYRLPNLSTWMDVLLWMGYLNSALNPALFSYQNIQFRKSYRQIGLFVLHWLNICRRNPS